MNLDATGSHWNRQLGEESRHRRDGSTEQVIVALPVSEVGTQLLLLTPLRRLGLAVLLRTIAAILSASVSEPRTMSALKYLKATASCRRPPKI